MEFLNVVLRKIEREAIIKAADRCAHLALKGMCLYGRVSELPPSLVSILRSDDLPAPH